MSEADAPVAALQPIPKDPKFTPKLNEALAKAQGKFVQPEKNKEVEVKKEGRLLYKTRYADLKNVIEAFRPHLSENGLSFTQKTVSSDKGWRLVLTLRHTSGEYDETAIPISLDGGPQQVGSSLTYLKRYQAAAYFGIAADDDDDANGATGNQADFKDKEPKDQAKTQPKAAAAAKTETKKPAEQPKDKKAEPKPAPAEKPIDEKDPAEFVMPFGMMEGQPLKGKRLKEVPEGTLKSILVWCGAELEKTPPPQNMSMIFDVQCHIKAFLNSVGVQVG